MGFLRPLSLLPASVASCEFLSTPQQHPKTQHLDSALLHHSPHSPVNSGFLPDPLLLSPQKNSFTSSSSNVYLQEEKRCVYGEEVSMKMNLFLKNKVHI